MPSRTPPSQRQVRTATPLIPNDVVPLSTDGRRARGQSTRNLIVAEAVQLASTDGLNGLSMGALAERLSVPKSSVHAAFGSKQELQLAVLDETRTMMIDLVVAPSLRLPEGDARLVAVGKSWIAYLNDDIFEGGCVLSAAASEIDGHPGPPRDALVAVMNEWLTFLANNVRVAIKLGEYHAATDPDQIAFQLHSIGLTANWHHQLFGGTTGFKQARTAWTRMLASLRDHT